MSLVANILAASFALFNPHQPFVDFVSLPSTYPRGCNQRPGKEEAAALKRLRKNQQRLRNGGFA